MKSIDRQYPWIITEKNIFPKIIRGIVIFIFQINITHINENVGIPWYYQTDYNGFN